MRRNVCVCVCVCVYVRLCVCVCVCVCVSIVTMSVVFKRDVVHGQKRSFTTKVLVSLVNVSPGEGMFCPLEQAPMIDKRCPSVLFCYFCLSVCLSVCFLLSHVQSASPFRV